MKSANWKNRWSYTGAKRYDLCYVNGTIKEMHRIHHSTIWNRDLVIDESNESIYEHVTGYFTEISIKSMNPSRRN